MGPSDERALATDRSRVGAENWALVYRRAVPIGER